MAMFRGSMGRVASAGAGDFETFANLGSLFTRTLISQLLG
jgi:hypothetical protein